MKSPSTHQRRVMEPEALPATDAQPCKHSAIDSVGKLRRRFFADAGDAVKRYGVPVDRIIGHLHEIAERRPSFRLDVGRLHMTDLVVAVAACDDHLGAWNDIISTHESVLHQSAEAHLGEIDALMAVRRLLAELRGCDRDTAGPMTLRSYAGDTSLRAWLLDRLVATLCIQSSARCGQPRVVRCLTSVRRLRLGVRLIHVDGLTARQAARVVGLREADLLRAASRRGMTDEPGERQHGMRQGGVPAT
ncbi:MAG: hypothetical protein KAS72_10445 [Phycisphaerales bacterium]|nr:hypothetical protein [Phycisphaerales bacterium]